MLKNLKDIRGEKQFLFCCLRILEEHYNEAIIDPYHPYYQYKQGKRRLIEEPNEKLKPILVRLLKILLKQVSVPEYVFSVTAKHGIKQNVQQHINRKENINFDISHYFYNTKQEYVEKMFKEKFKMSDTMIKMIIPLVIYKGHIPTGAPTSPLIAFLTHQSLFDSIYNKARSQNIIMTLYIDDLTFSSNNHIGSWLYKYCKKQLKLHALWIKKNKIKHFGYKSGWVTGVRINQVGKLSIAHSEHFDIYNTLRTKPINEMNLTEVRQLLGKIAFVKQFSPKQFYISNKNLQKRLKVLLKTH